ncbi:MAG: serine hydrolase [Treponema sp.]|nr:serine hydrolase [Treponema sp.]
MKGTSRRTLFTFIFLACFSTFQLSADWQIDVTFPDWRESPNANFFVNDVTGFYGYHNQGTIFITPSENCAFFSLYINSRRIPLAGWKAGHTSAFSIGSYTKDGINSLQVSDIEPKGSATVQVCVPYPTIVTDGAGTKKAFKEAGISQKAFSFIERIIQADIDHGFGAAQLAVIKDGKLVYSNAWGTVQTYNADGTPYKNAPKATTDTLFDLASNTKMYSVNYALQYLISKDCITLNTKISDILGSAFYEDTIDIQYRVGKKAHIPLSENKAYKKQLTVGDLLRHEAGFPASVSYYNDNYNPAILMSQEGAVNALYAGAGADSATREKTFAALCKTPLLYRPGESSMYSDIDYIALTFVIEKLTGLSLDSFLSQVFWEPLGLKHITFRPLDHGFVKNDCAATELNGNSRNGTEKYTGIRTDVIQGEVHDENAWYAMAGVSGNAGLFSNAEDLAVLASVMLSGGYGFEQFFSPVVIDVFSAPKNTTDTDWGLGWWREGYHGNDRHFGSFSDRDVIGHQGFTGSMTVIDRTEHLVIVFLTNKIHSPLIAGGERSSRFFGNYYLTGSLGFVTQVIRLGMHLGSNFDAMCHSLLNDAIQDARNRAISEGIDEKDPFHPYIRALRALESLK